MKKTHPCLITEECKKSINNTATMNFIEPIVNHFRNSPTEKSSSFDISLSRSGSSFTAFSVCRWRTTEGISVSEPSWSLCVYSIVTVTEWEVELCKKQLKLQATPSSYINQSEATLNWRHTRECSDHSHRNLSQILDLVSHHDWGRGQSLHLVGHWSPWPMIISGLDNNIWSL